MMHRDQPHHKHKLAVAQEGAQEGPYSPLNWEPRSYREFLNPLLVERNNSDAQYSEVGLRIPGA